jgi:hypothetical protein
MKQLKYERRDLFAMSITLLLLAIIILYRFI